MTLRVYLCGQGYFGQEAMRLLVDRPDCDVVGVSSPPETRGGREDRLWRLAGLEGIPRLAAGELRSHLLPPGTDLIVCAHSHDYLGRPTRNAARLGAIGYHPSLLPLHRGRDAIRWAIRDRDRVTGGTAYWFNDTIDGGPIAAQDWCFIRPDDDAESLWRRELQPMGLRLLGRTINDIASGTLVRIPQDRRLATWEPAMGAPPLFRPELPQIGGGWEGYRVVVEAE